MGILTERGAPDEQSQYPEIARCLLRVGNYLAKHAKKAGLSEINILVLGGAALHLTGFRETFSDVDVIVKELAISKAIPSTLLKENGMDIEIGFDLKLGSLDDPEAYDRAKDRCVRFVDGVTVNISIYPEHFFLLLKMEHGREKCQHDICNMLIGIDHKRVISAFNDLALSNEQWLMDDLADMLVTDYAMLLHLGSMRGDSLDTLKDVVDQLSVSDEARAQMKRIYMAMKIDQKKRSLSRSSESYSLAI